MNTWQTGVHRYRDQLDPIWATTLAELVDDGGIGTIEWLCLDTGAVLLLAASGSWKSGGAYSLHWLSPATSAITDITRVLHAHTPRQTLHYNAGDPVQWDQVRGELIRIVEERVLAGDADRHG